MTDFRQVTDSYAVSPQIQPGDIVRAKADGFVMVINNRPDGEVPDQPSSAEMEAAAKAAGLAYRHIPVRGGPTPDQATEQAEAIAQAGGPVLAYCRSGTRSIITWSQAAAKNAGLSRDEIVAKGSAAGYDLSGVV
jgi:uncharacterized protein (TIGR01244 family)